VDHDETPFGKVLLKVRCRLKGGYQLQVWLHHEPGLQAYAYQLFTDHPLLRWDNAPHYPQIETSPHHSHDEHGALKPSPLKGNPIADLRVVLQEVERFLSEKS